MTRIEILYNNNNIVGFSSKGHTGYAEEGSDIVCAAISSITGAAAVGIIKVLKLDADYRIGEKNGEMFLKLIKKASSEEIEKAQIIFRTMVISLEEIVKDYNKYVKMEARDEIY